MQNIRAEVVLPARDVREDIPFFTKKLGFRLDEIYPADDPQVIVLSGYGLRVRFDQTLEGPPGHLRVLCDDPVLIAGGETSLTSPSGTHVEIVPLAPAVVMPETQHEFTVRRIADQAPWVIGRAGMHYRDLIPSRLGGSIIASHIRIPDGGPVPDMVHFHSIGFQLIFCLKGWVDLVYEDQGEPFRLEAGNCVIQPPEIRHRVLYASDNIEVIEIGVPAEHVTTIDHDLELPTADFRPDREWDGQRFVHHRAEEAKWEPFRLSGFTSRDTTIAEHTKGVASVHVVRAGEGRSEWATHDADIHFSFVMSGEVTLEGEGQKDAALSAGDAFVIPPALRTRLSSPSADLEILEVALPGSFATKEG
ncbi:MAG: cupin domain-containing protein [Rhodobacteraceae bacterium]|nr:cupin domain-containing protein [Paracoccaceae bacterium]